MRNNFLSLEVVDRGRGGGPRVVVGTAAFHARVRGSVPGLGGLKETKLFLPHPRVKVSIVGSLRDREVACSASDRQGSNFESCVWRTVSSQSSHHPQEVLLAQFSLDVHKGGLKPDSFHFWIAAATHNAKWVYVYFNWIPLLLQGCNVFPVNTKHFYNICTMLWKCFVICICECPMFNSFNQLYLLDFPYTPSHEETRP